MLAITKASMKAMFKNPSSVGFSIGFPLIFILVFGFIGGSGPSVSFALVKGTDTTDPVIANLLKNPLVQLEKEKIRRSSGKTSKREGSRLRFM
ncbi:hypothetical protein ACQ86N_14080 [Puia sp. P3]|uniref:hypothetical protein n=1 Tax=Puia sp. P3 TaxID=3423952 RepID=UPI003D66CB25